MPIGNPTHLYSVFQGTSKAAIGDIVVHVAKCGDVFLLVVSGCLIVSGTYVGLTSQCFPSYQRR